MSTSWPSRSARLSTVDHDRNVAGLRYVYAVLSRRARGVSVGIDLNPNRACNWRCIYCQVPGLTRGAGPPIELRRLTDELRRMLSDLVDGDFMRRRVPSAWRRLAAVAFSGSGEPTSSPQLAAAVRRVGAVLAELALARRLAVVLITNGSLIHRAEVLDGLDALAEIGGEVWFKVDAVGAERRRRVNDTAMAGELVRRNLILAGERCRTRIQSCVFALDGRPPPVEEQAAFVDFMARLRADGAGVADVLLYGPERPSQQPEASRIAKLPRAWIEDYAERIRAVGMPVRVCS